MLTHKGYLGSAEIDDDCASCVGRVLHINDLVTYQADSAADLKKAFEEAVDDYLETCKELGRDPNKSYNGVFQVRVQPELHKHMALRATADRISLNAVVEKALRCYVDNDSGVVHNHTTTNYHITVRSDDSEVRMVSSSSTGELRANVH